MLFLLFQRDSDTRRRHGRRPLRRRPHLGTERLEARQLLSVSGGTASEGTLPLLSPGDLAAPAAAVMALPRCNVTAPQFITSAGKATPSGDYRIDDLQTGFKWGTNALTYSFYAGGAYYGTESTPTPVSEAVKANVRHVLADVIAPLINVTFTEVPDSPTSYGLLRYLCSPAASYAYAYIPTGADTNNGSRSDVVGDIVLNPSNDVVGSDSNSRNNSFQSAPGSHGFQSLIHETCHALGLKHPFESPTLPRAEENWDNTVMTYNFVGSEPATAMAYDVLALQYLYGAKTSTRPEDTRYTFTAADNFSPGSGATGAPGSPYGRMKNMLWDGGGVDTVDLSALSAATGGFRIDIQPGGWITNTTAYNAVSYDTTQKTTDYGTRIPLTGTTIENVVGSRSADTIILNTAANTVSGYAPGAATGTDVISNADQSDTLDLGLFKQTDVTQTQSGTDLVVNLGGGSTVTVKNYYGVAAGSRMLIQFKSQVSLAITADRTVVKGGDTAAITFTLGGSSTTFTAGDVIATGGTLSGFTGSGAGYRATFTPTPGFAGTATITVAAGTFTDASGLPNTAGSLSLSVDTIRPTVAITRAGTGVLRSGDTDTVTFALSEASTTFAAADVTVVGGALSGFTGSGGTYTALFTAAAGFNGTASVAVPAGVFTDAAGNANLAATPLAISVGTITPTLAIGRAGAGTLKIGDTDTITFTLSADSTTFTAADVVVAGGVLSDFTGRGSSYQATLTPTRNLEAVATIAVAAGAFVDAYGTPNAGGSLQLPVDTNAPTLVITRSGTGVLRAGQTDTITFALSEPSTTFTAADVAVVGGALSGFGGAGGVYTAVFAPAAGFAGTATVAVATGAFTDAAGNGNMPAGPLWIAIGTLAPTVTIGRTGTGTLKLGDTDTITFSLGASTTGFTAADVAVDGGTLSDFTGDGSSYRATFTPAPNAAGVATITVAAGAFADAFGSPNAAGSLQVPLDTTAATVAISRAGAGRLRAGDTDTITFTLGRPSTTFTAADVTVRGGSLSRFAGSGVRYTAIFTPAAGFNGTATIAVAAGTFTDAVGNANLAAATLAIPVDTVVVPITVSSPGLGSSALDAVRLSGELRSIRLVFSQPVTGLTLSSLRLRANGRSISLVGAVIGGGGAEYTLELPRGRTAMRAGYVLEISPATIVSGQARMTTAARFFWTHQSNAPSRPRF